MQSYKKNSVVVFFSNNVSLELWEKKQIIERELKLYKYLSSKNIRVLLVTYGNKKDNRIFNKYKIKNISIVPLYANIKKNFITKNIIYLLSPIILYKYIKNYNFLTTHQISGGITALINKFFFKKKLILRLGWEPTLRPNSWGIGKIKSFFLTLNSYLCYFFSNIIIVSSDEIKNFIKKKYFFSSKIMIPNSINTKVFKKINVKKSKEIITIARLVEQKNLFKLIDIISDLNLTGTIVGEGDLKKKLMIYAKKKNAKIKFIGKIKNSLLPRIINTHKIFLTTSYNEGSPKAVLESMSCQVPVFAIKKTYLSEIMTNREGYLGSNDKKLKKELINNLRLRMYYKKGVNARNKVLNRFENSICFKKYFNLYTSSF